MKHKIVTISIVANTYEEVNNEQVVPGMLVFVHRLAKNECASYENITPASQERVLRAAKKLVQA